MQPLPEDLLKMLAAKATDQENRFNSGQQTAAEQTLAGATDTMGAVHFGGPLSGPVVAIHGSSKHAEAETGSGIYVAAQKQHLEALVRNKLSPYRLIIGHVGWQNKQLSDELAAGVWHIVPATTEAVFTSDQDMWPRLVRRATAHSMANWIGIPDVPEAAILN
jgi:putative transcriptional regulator